MSALPNLPVAPAKPSLNHAAIGKTGGTSDDAAFSRLLEQQRSQARQAQAAQSRRAEARAHQDETPARPAEEAGHRDETAAPPPADAQAAPMPWLTAMARPVPTEGTAPPAGGVAAAATADRAVDGAATQDGAVDAAATAVGGALTPPYDLAATAGGNAPPSGATARKDHGPLAVGDDIEARREPRVDPSSLADAPVVDPRAALAAGMPTLARPREASGVRTDPGAVGAFAPGTATLHADDAGAVASVTLPAPVEAPEFPHLLGVQVSLLARQGVQRAELHLNPADMGPVSVQIAIDGTQARVQFGADMAATRQAIEGGLPELAAALRDAGLTLTGGGVSEHARGQAGDQADGGHARSRAIDAPASDVDAAQAGTSRRAVVRLPQGAVDVYA